MDLGYGNSFHLLTSEHLLQMTIFEKMVEFDIFYRDPKKCFSPLRISIHDWQIIETIRDRRYKKEKVKVQHDNLALFRKNMVWHMKKKVTRNSKINSFFNFLLIFSSFPMNCKLVFFII